MKKMIITLIFGLFFLLGSNVALAATLENNSITTVEANATVPVNISAIISFLLSSDSPSEDTNGSTVNNAPIVNDGSEVTDEDTTINITVTGSDEDGDSLTYSISTLPSHGTASIVGNNITYTPNSNFSGDDVIGVIANDSMENSTEASIMITVTSVNDIPIVYDGTAITDEDIAINVNITGLDEDEDPLTYSISTLPSHGTVSIVGAVITYIPNSNFAGIDIIGVIVNDGTVDSTEANITVTVTSVNDAPVANDKVYVTALNEGCSASIVDFDITDNDVDIDGFIDVNSIEIITSPAHGVISIGLGGKVSYESSVSYEGNDGFSYKVRDNEGKLSNEANIVIRIEQSNTKPRVLNDKMRVFNNESTVLDILLNDVDDAGLDISSIVIGNNVSHGNTIITIDGKVEYTPDTNYIGIDSFTYTVQDNEGLISDEATVNITVVNNTGKVESIEEKATNWYVRIIAEDTTNNMKTAAAQLGQLEVSDAAIKHSLKAISPFRPTFLDVVFENPTGLPTGEYKSNFHTTATSDNWEFTIKSHDNNADIVLSWRGLYVLTSYVDEDGRDRYKEYRSLSNPLIAFMKLVDMGTGVEIPADDNGTAQVYTFNMSGNTSKTFKWVLENTPIPILAVPQQTKLLQTLKVQALRKDAKATPERLEKKRLESFDMMTPPTFKVLVK